MPVGVKPEQPRSDQTSPKGWLFVVADFVSDANFASSSGRRRRTVYRLVDRSDAILRVVQRSTSCVTSIAGPNGYAQQTQGVNVSTGPAAFLPRCQTA
jgi:hypothetical protein